MTMEVKTNTKYDLRSYNIHKIHYRDLSNDDSTDSIGQVSGTAIVYDQPSEEMGFTEYVDPHALDGVDLSDVVGLYNHDTSNVLGRTSNNTVKLTNTPTGLDFVIDLPNTQLGKDVRTLVQRQDIKGNSFGFTIAEDQWSGNEDSPVHRILKLGQLFEISLCAFPAYAETSVGVTRSLNEFKKEVSDLKDIKDVSTDDLKQELERRSKESGNKDNKSVNASPELGTILAIVNETRAKVEKLLELRAKDPAQQVVKPAKAPAASKTNAKDDGDQPDADDGGDSDDSGSSKKKPVKPAKGKQAPADDSDADDDDSDAKKKKSKSAKGKQRDDDGDDADVPDDDTDSKRDYISSKETRSLIDDMEGLFDED